LSREFGRVFDKMSDESKISDGQRFAIIKLFGKYTNERSCRLWLIGKIIGREIITTADITLSEWRKIRNEAYPNWGANDWETSDGWNRKCRELVDEYETEIIGQKRLF